MPSQEPKDCASETGGKRFNVVKVMSNCFRRVMSTTLDEIAAAAGISRRTFFYYFWARTTFFWRTGRTRRQARFWNASAGAPVDVARRLRSSA
jgi:hypothetical protein